LRPPLRSFHSSSRARPFKCGAYTFGLFATQVLLYVLLPSTRFPTVSPHAAADDDQVASKAYHGRYCAI
jgi:hypothetical protein